MEDQELEALRAKRMAEMQAKAVSTSKYCSYDEKFLVEIKKQLELLRNNIITNWTSLQGVGGPGKMGGDPGSQAQAQEDKQRQVEDMKNSILSQVLTQEARARCKYSF